MMSLAERLLADQRGIVLRSLDEGGYRLVESSLRTVLRHHGHMISLDELRAVLEWLERQGLVRVDREPVERREVWIVQLLDLGQLVAQGRSHPGVGRGQFAPPQ